MILDHPITKPKNLQLYQLHQMVKGLTEGASSLFADAGDALMVRTEKEITRNGQPLRTYVRGDILGFELRACVAKKKRGRHIYFPTRDWRNRHAWLNRQGEQHGFQPLTVNCRSELATIDDGKQRKFTVDQTDFVGVLRVMDEDLFATALANGIGSTAKAFGFGMMII